MEKNGENGKLEKKKTREKRVHAIQCNEMRYVMIYFYGKMR